MKLLIAFKKKRLRGLHKRKRNTSWQHVREYIWPSMGLLPFLRLLELKIKRQKEGLHPVALGAAIGVFVSFLPIVGQMFLSMLLAMLLRGNAVVAFICSFIGNFWTFPIIFTWSYNIGNLLLRVPEPQPFPPINEFLNVIINIGEIGWSLFLPTFVGGLILGSVAAIISYFFVRANIASYQIARRRFLEHRKKLRYEHRAKTKKLPPKHVRE
ncbi:MAG: DUF2062 domain-containing protein [Alphaproteobacteria bacterium]|nr:DUF2062 domain-containing protein [Alphaproteobacteria bacterium]MDD9920386.1 DUF2062 domain-containing protein [Alphaproteobacteria bacterium]